LSKDDVVVTAEGRNVLPATKRPDY